MWCGVVCVGGECQRRGCTCPRMIPLLRPLTEDDQRRDHRQHDREGHRFHHRHVLGEERRGEGLLVGLPHRLVQERAQRGLHHPEAAQVPRQPQQLGRVRGRRAAVAEVGPRPRPERHPAPASQLPALPVLLVAVVIADPTATVQLHHGGGRLVPGGQRHEVVLHQHQRGQLDPAPASVHGVGLLAVAPRALGGVKGGGGDRRGHHFFPQHAMLEKTIAQPFNGFQYVPDSTDLRAPRPPPRPPRSGPGTASGPAGAAPPPPPAPTPAARSPATC